MAYASITKFRYQWNDDDDSWDGISTASMSLEAIIPLSTGSAPRVSPFISGGYAYVRGAFHRETNHQIWIAFGRSIGSQAYRVCFIGVSGTGVVSEDAEAIKSWVFTHLTLDPGNAWPAKWTLAPVVVVPDPVVVITSGEDEDDGFLRTQFRRQSILRRRNG